MNTEKPKESPEQKHARELDALRRIQEILKHPDKRYEEERSVIEGVINERAKAALDYRDHITVTIEDSPLEKFADAQAAEIEQIKYGESVAINFLNEKIKTLQDEINVLNSFFKAYNGE